MLWSRIPAPLIWQKRLSSSVSRAPKRWWVRIQMYRATAMVAGLLAAWSSKACRKAQAKPPWGQVVFTSVPGQGGAVGSGDAPVVMGQEELEVAEFGGQAWPQLVCGRAVEHHRGTGVETGVIQLFAQVGALSQNMQSHGPHSHEGGLAGSSGFIGVGRRFCGKVGACVGQPLSADFVRCSAGSGDGRGACHELGEGTTA